MSTIPADLVPRTGDSLETLFSKVLGRLNEMEVSGGGPSTPPPAASTTVAGVTRYATVAEAPSTTLLTAALTPGAVAQGGLTLNQEVPLTFGSGVNASSIEQAGDQTLKLSSPGGTVIAGGLTLPPDGTGVYSYVPIDIYGTTPTLNLGPSGVINIGSSGVINIGSSGAITDAGYVIAYSSSIGNSFSGQTAFYDGVSFQGFLGGLGPYDAQFSNNWAGPLGVVYAHSGASGSADTMTLTDYLVGGSINMDSSGGQVGDPFIGLGTGSGTSIPNNPTALTPFFSYFGVGSLAPTSANMRGPSMAFGLSPTTYQPCLFYCDGSGVFYQIALGAPSVL